MNDVKFYLDAAEKKMQEAVDFLDDTLAHIRAGKANVKILDGIRVNYYGSPVPIDNVANVSTPDQRTIAIMPWERNMIGAPVNNGEVIRLNIPPLTEERRKLLVKDTKAESEKARVSIRNARREAIEGLKKAVKEGMSEDVSKDGEDKVQKIHDKFMKKIDELFAAKEKEILTV